MEIRWLLYGLNLDVNTVKSVTIMQQLNTHTYIGHNLKTMSKLYSIKCKRKELVYGYKGTWEMTVWSNIVSLSIV